MWRHGALVHSTEVLLQPAERGDLHLMELTWTFPRFDPHCSMHVLSLET